MERIILNKSQFEWFNDEDCYFLFEKEMNFEYELTPQDEKPFFNYQEFIQKKTDELFERFEFIVVTADDKIYGLIGNNVEIIKQFESAYECAQQVFNS